MGAYNGSMGRETEGWVRKREGEIGSGTQYGQFIGVRRS